MGSNLSWRVLLKTTHNSQHFPFLVRKKNKYTYDCCLHKVNFLDFHEALVRLLAKVKLGFTKLCEEEMLGECWEIFFYLFWLEFSTLLSGRSELDRQVKSSQNGALKIIGQLALYKNHNPRSLQCYILMCLINEVGSEKLDPPVCWHAVNLHPYMQASWLSRKFLVSFFSIEVDLKHHKVLDQVFYC